MSVVIGVKNINGGANKGTSKAKKTKAKGKGKSNAK